MLTRSPHALAAQCAACWAFATSAALESLQLIRFGRTLDLSEQQLIDCVGAALGYGSLNSIGGYMHGERGKPARLGGAARQRQGARLVQHTFRTCLPDWMPPPLPILPRGV